MFSRRDIIGLLFVLFLLPCVSADSVSFLDKINGSLEDDARFGYSPSLYGDYLAVGAALESLGGSNRGAVYVFKRGSSDSFNFISKFNGTLENDAAFGYRVSLYGDYLAVGAYGESMGGSNRGAAYIFKRNSSDDFNFLQKLNGTLENNAYFGIYVSLYGDYLAVGAYGESLGGTNRGAAYVFKRNSSDDFNFLQKFNGTLENGAYFGDPVSLHGDYLVVAAHQEGMGGTDRGAAYVFKLNSSDDFNFLQKFNGTLEDGAYFGDFVSMYGDYLVVGAERENMGGGDRGAAYVFKRNSSDDFNLVQKLNGTLENSAYFGSAISLYGNYLSVGAFAEDMGGVARGSAYVFKRNSSDDFNFIFKLNGSLENDAYFGRFLSLYGDYLVVGAYLENMSGSDRGAAYVFKIVVSSVSVSSPAVRSLLPFGSLLLALILVFGVFGWLMLS